MSFLSVEIVSELLNAEVYGEIREIPQEFLVDSRLVTKNSVFIALKGEHADGFDYISEAISNGASVVIANADHPSKEEIVTHNPQVLFLLVKCSNKALAELAKYWLDLVNPKVVAITGSVGKTTTRELVTSAFSKTKRVHSAIKSYNTLVGCSLTILMMPQKAEILVLELGTNHPGEIAEMVGYFTIDYAVITEIAPAHLEGLTSIDGILKAKMEIADGGRLRYLAYNFDNEALKGAISTDLRLRNTLLAGVGYSSDNLRIISVDQTLIKSNFVLNVVYQYREDTFSIACNVFGIQHAYNIGYSYLIATQLGVNADEVIRNLEGVQNQPGRGQLLLLEEDIYLLDDTYNSNPCSLVAATDNVKSLNLPVGYRRIAILSGMRELGRKSSWYHQEVLKNLSGFDAVFLVGEEWDCAIACPSPIIARTKKVDSIIPFCQPYLTAKSFTLVKGSRYYKMEAVIQSLIGACY